MAAHAGLSEPFEHISEYVSPDPRDIFTVCTSPAVQVDGSALTTVEATAADWPPAGCDAILYPEMNRTKIATKTSAARTDVPACVFLMSVSSR